MVIFDEVHKFKSILNPDVHYIGFTATPREETLKLFPDIITKRTLGWGIKNGILNDYEICTFIWKNDVVDGLSTKMVVYSDMIKTIIDIGSSKRMIVFCSTVNDAREIMRLLHQSNITAVTITGETKHRKELENSVKDAPNHGVLISVDIYKEGADLPWLDSAFYCRADMNEINLVQSMGRTLRKSPNKDISRIYFPVIEEANSSYTECSSSSFEKTLQYIEYISKHDPDVFRGSEQQDRKSKIKRILYNSGNSKSAKGNILIEDVVNIDDALAIKISDKLNLVHKVIFNCSTWMNCTIAVILCLCQNTDRFITGHVKKYATAVQEYRRMKGLSSTGITPENTMSRAMTEDMKKRNYIQRMDDGTWLIINREGMMKEIGGIIPEEFIRTVFYNMG
jgi:superfamily II DNA/RNA helicase